MSLEYSILRIARRDGFYMKHIYKRERLNESAEISEMIAKGLICFRERYKNKYNIYKLTNKGLKKLFSVYKERYLNDQVMYLKKYKEKLNKYQSYTDTQKDSLIISIINSTINDINTIEREIELVTT